MFNAMLMRSRNKKGFTLMEMLIVVAIIAILVAVSFPVFNAQLGKAQKATDQANVRAAKAVAMATYLTADPVVAFVKYYDADKGIIVPNATDVNVVYGKSSSTVEGATGIPDKKIIKVTVDGNGEFEAAWVPNA